MGNNVQGFCHWAGLDWGQRQEHPGALQSDLPVHLVVGVRLREVKHQLVDDLVLIGIIESWALWRGDGCGRCLMCGP
jgi:hypothetical protein